MVVSFLASLTSLARPTPVVAQAAGGPRPTIAAEPEGYDRRYETDRIILLARKDEPNAEQLTEMAADLGESAVRVRELLGTDRAPMYS